MKTEKPITSISYNTVDFLKATCDKLLKNGIIDFYAFLKHRGEIDEFDGTRDKDHIHIFLRPLRALDTATLCTNFYEIDQSNPTAPPLGCVHFEKCKSPGEWVLYTLHYQPYLDSKGLTKEFVNYPFDEFITNNEQELKRFRRSYKIEFKPKLGTVKTLLEQGCNRAQIMEKVNPSAVQYLAIDKMVASEYAKDSDFTVIDNRTGEKIYG